MSWYSGGELVTGGWTSSNYAGHGILFENLPTAGENGGSPLLNDGGVNGDEVRWQLLTVTGLTVDEFNEDGSFVSTGIGSFDYRSYVNGVAVGDFTATAQAAGTTYSLTCDTVSDTHTAETVTLTYITAAGVNYSLVCDSAADTHSVESVTFTYTAPSGTAYSITCDVVSDAHTVNSVTFNRGYMFTADPVSDSSRALAVNLIYSGAEIALMGSYSVNYKQSDVGISYKQISIEVNYGGR